MYNKKHWKKLKLKEIDNFTEPDTKDLLKRKKYVQYFDL